MLLFLTFLCGETDCHVASLLAMTEGEACHCEQRSCPRAHVLPSACHCEPVRTLVRQSASPQRKERISGTLGEFVTPYGFAGKNCFSVCAAAGETDCPAPRNHHVFSHHDKRKCDILEAWQKFAVISPIWKINYYLNKLQNLGWQPPNICYGLSII